jgi:hypothetical protein
VWGEYVSHHKKGKNRKKLVEWEKTEKMFEKE